MPPKPTPPFERFFKYLNITMSCWEWTGALRNGYGYLTTTGRRREYAHRLAYQLFVGEIPKGLEIDHLCRNRKCVNPDHLEAVEHVVNVQRAADEDRSAHCPKGHFFDADNTIMTRAGRRCYKCDTDRARKYRFAHAVEINVKKRAWREARRKAGLKAS